MLLTLAAASLQLLGPMTVRVVDAVPNARVERVVVLLHGFGAPGDDLVDFVQYLPPKPGVRYVLPEGPLAFGDGRAFWIIDWDERTRYLRAGGWEAYADVVPDGLAEASATLSAMLDAIEVEWGIPAERIVIGGFSQGAMLALDVVAQRVRKPAALIFMSGSMSATPRWRPNIDAFVGMPVFISHGRRDETLPYAMAERLRDELRGAGAKVTWVPFNGGHTTPRKVMRALAKFLAQ